METLNSRRRWFTFTIRESLLIVALAATGVGWYVDHSRIKDLPTIVSVMDQKIKTNNITPRPDVWGNAMGPYNPLQTKVLYRGRRFELVIELRD